MIDWTQQAEDKTRAYLRQQSEHLSVLAGDTEIGAFCRGMLGIRLRCHDINLPGGRLRELAREELQRKEDTP